MLNVIFVFCCIPIVTIGPAYTALYYSVMKTVKKDRGYGVKNFFHSFKQNLLQGAAIWMIFLVLGTASGYLLYSLWNSTASGGPQFTFWIVVVVAFFLLCMLVYIFPILSRFDFGLGQMFAFSYLMAVRYFIYSVLLIVLTAVCIAVGYICPPLVIIVLPALYAYISSSLIEKVFAVYMPMFEAPAGEEKAAVGENGEDAGSEGGNAGSEGGKSENGEDGVSGDGAVSEPDKQYKDQWYYD